ncbi:MAG: hypothetical protein QOD88_1932, partial [Mycobacterium sp.]|nr:hypothetical protein [Mycobacterium sp.]
MTPASPRDPRGIGQHVDRGDTPTADHEAHDGGRLAGDEDHRAGGAVDDGGPDLARRVRVATGQPGDSGCPAHRALSAGAEVAAQRHVGVQNGDQPVEVTGTPGGEEGVDDGVLGSRPVSGPGAVCWIR